MKIFAMGAAVALLVTACGGATDQESVASEFGGRTTQVPVVVYSDLAESEVKPVFDVYTAETGVPVKYVFDSEQPLVEKLKAEGRNGSADLLLLSDAGTLMHAAEEDVLRPTYSEILQANIPGYLQDPENMWFALSIAAPAIVYDSREVKPGELGGYGGLADRKWHGKLCLASSREAANQTLVAMMIAQNGERPTELLVRGWVQNLVTSVFPGYDELLRAIESGQCQVGIATTPHLARLQQKNSDTPVTLFWPPAEDGGVHINISGAAVTRHAHNPKAAAALLEWMSGTAGQRLLSGAIPGYPVNSSATPHELLDAWVRYDASPIRVAQAGMYRVDAVRLLERARYR